MLLLLLLLLILLLLLLLLLLVILLLLLILLLTLNLVLRYCLKPLLLLDLVQGGLFVLELGLKVLAFFWGNLIFFQIVDDNLYPNPLPVNLNTKA